MPSYNASQRAAIAQFVSFTQAKESIAARVLKSNDWDVERAVNAHFSSTTTNNGPSATQKNLNMLFDKYRDQPKIEPDRIGIEGTMPYFEAIGANPEHAISAALFDQLSAPELGVFTRDNFVQGWTEVSTPTNPCDTEKHQKQYLETLKKKLTTDPAYFKQIYKNTFQYAKPENQRAVPLEIAFAYWEMFFTGKLGGIEWNTSTTKWWDLWSEYYSEKNKRPVNKDLWNQVAELVNKTREPGGEDLSWWSEDGAWPTAVDDFVAFVKEKRSSEGAMDTN